MMNFEPEDLPVILNEPIWNRLMVDDGKAPSLCDCGLFYCPFSIFTNSYSELTNGGVFLIGMTDSQICVKKALFTQVEGLSFPGATSPTLQSINLQVNEGEFILITGPNASGKSVLCHLLSGTIPLFQAATIQGVTELFGRATDTLSLPQVVEYLGYMQQDISSQSFSITVEEDVSFGLGNLGYPVSEIRSRVQSALEAVGLSGYEQRGPETLSGGEAQRAVLAGILALDPPVMILDQPTSEMDPWNRQKVWELLGTLNRQGKTILIVENEIETLLPFVSRVLRMKEGRIFEDVLVNQGKTTNILKRMRAREDTCGAALTDERLGLTYEKPEINQKTCQPGAVKFSSCHYTYSDGFNGLKGIELEIGRGEFAAIVGPNGSGKTTLAKHINGLLRPTAGQVTINGKDTRQQKVETLAREVAFVFQNPDNQIFSSSVLNEVSFALRIRGLKRAVIEEKAENILKRVGLWNLRHEHPYRLSLGQRQLLAIASILISESLIVVADEPTTGLDPHETEKVMNLLYEVNEQGKTVIIITHNLELVRRYASRCIFMQQGVIKADSLGSEVLSVFSEFENKRNSLVEF